MKKILTLLALLWGLPAYAQGIPTGGEGSLCIATAAARTLSENAFAVLSCDLSGQLRTTGAGGGGGGGNAATTSNATDGQATSATNQQNVTYNYLYNGTTWDRARGTGGAANVAVTNFPATQAVTNAGTFAVQNTAAVVGGNATAVKTDGSATTQPVSGTVSALNLGIYNSTAPTITNGAQTILQATANGSLFVDLSRSPSVAVTEASGANVTLGATGDAANASTVLGQLKQSNVLLGAATPAGTNNIGRVASDASSFPGGLSNVSIIPSALASTNATLAKNASGRAYKITGYNAAASIRWLKLYNKATAPVPGTDTPYFQLPLPPGAFSFDAQDIGYYFNTGIGYAITTGAANTDATAVTAADILNLNVWYQ